MAGYVGTANYPPCDTAKQDPKHNSNILDAVAILPSPIRPLYEGTLLGVLKRLLMSEGKKREGY